MAWRVAVVKAVERHEVFFDKKIGVKAQRRPDFGDHQRGFGGKDLEPEPPRLHDQTVRPHLGHHTI